MDRQRHILGEEWGRSLAEALGIDPDKTSRIVIDVRPREPIKVYVEKIATERLLNLSPPSIEWCEIETKTDGPIESEEVGRYWLGIRRAKEGERCCFCGHTYTSTADIVDRDVIPVDDPNTFKIACKTCYEKHK
jgi:hypothetical protein